MTPTSLIGSGAKAGPLVMRDFPEGSTDATIRGWRPGTIEKVLIRQVESSPDLIVRGSRCGDGHPLRFWYDRPGAAPLTSDPFRTPIPNEVLDTMGDSVLVLPSFEQGTPARERDHPGYMLFTSDGDWRIDVWNVGGTHLGSAVLRVTTQP